VGKKGDKRFGKRKALRKEETVFNHRKGKTISWGERKVTFRNRIRVNPQWPPPKQEKNTERPFVIQRETKLVLDKRPGAAKSGG